MCVRGDQQNEGERFTVSDLYSPVLRAPEARLLAAIAAEHGCQAFLYGDIGDDMVYIRPPDWWPEPIPEVICFSKASMEPNRPPDDGTFTSRNV